MSTRSNPGRVEVSTTSYEFSHGRKPRGEGSWAFFFAGSDEPRWFSGRYSDAKSQAVAAASSMGVDRIAVGS